MLVDDSALDQYINKLILTQCALDDRLIQFQSGQDGLDYLISQQFSYDAIPDILLLDINMPGMDGFQFLKEFEKLPEMVRSKCNVYILSSSCDPDDLRRAHKNPYVKSFIEKPLSKQFVREDLMNHMIKIAV